MDKAGFGGTKASLEDVEIFARVFECGKRFEWAVNGCDAMRSIGIRRYLSMCAVLVIAGISSACASRPESGYLNYVAEIAPGAREHTVLIATTRQRDARPGTLFNGERAHALDYAKVTISVPQRHINGEIEWPSNPPGDSKSNFVAEKAAYLDGDREFIQALNAQLALRPREDRKVLLFIHGYNTMFAEGLYRFAQVVHDSGSPAVPVLFTWASHGQLKDYVYDTNSATSARDDLEHTIRLLFATNAIQINILAHSLGNWVTVEALRQIKISGRIPNLDKLGMVVLAAPDIDVDVFKSQMRRFGKPRKPFYIILSKDDKALGFSSFVAGGRDRLGAYQNVNELAALGAVVIDLTDLKATDSSDHSKFAQIASIAPQLRTVLEKGIDANSKTLSQNAPSVGTTLGDVISMPIRIVGEPITIISGR